MGNNSNRDPSALLLFTFFGMLITLFFILITLIFQTWALWKMARVVVEQNTPAEEMEGNAEGMRDGKRRSRSMGSRSSGAGFFAGGTLVGKEEGGTRMRFE
ncbi:hypothetical protein P154DRAFT_576194 [Amniculicola lignicola CBS 123094]|uniref:Uncharacterized protein n=1 Tax=Amniculicola lignicola CBS 123094 TaxID=1392246 RepID=A0A6A5WE77_9PLEO|nr:hypothetical protein P154DRAFT_576194 [Amniculicola lignicola CBS 123094]